MKRIKLFILLVVCLMVVPVVHAASANTVITGTNTVKVGKTTNIYIKLNSSANIEGVDVTYSTSGNISVTNVSIASTFSKMGQNGQRYILYAMNPVPSGSTVLTLTVKGNAVGKGTVTVSNLEATVSGETVVGGFMTDGTLQFISTDENSYDWNAMLYLMVADKTYLFSGYYTMNVWTPAAPTSTTFDGERQNYVELKEPIKVEPIINQWKKAAAPGKVEFKNQINGTSNLTR